MCFLRAGTFLDSILRCHKINVQQYRIIWWKTEQNLFLRLGSDKQTLAAWHFIWMSSSTLRAFAFSLPPLPFREECEFYVCSHRPKLSCMPPLGYCQKSQTPLLD